MNTHCLNIAFITFEAYGIIIRGNFNNYDNIKSLQALSYLQSWNANFWLTLGYTIEAHREKPGSYAMELDNYCKQRRDIAILSWNLSSPFIWSHTAVLVEKNNSFFHMKTLRKKSCVAHQPTSIRPHCLKFENQKIIILLKYKLSS